tara:strand:- start:340 stop:621 length:282 start_codon:yes stop_codon:yes gene_type:complete
VRVIERNMLDAIETKVNWVGDNTEVVYHPNADYSKVYLYDNLIAWVLHGEGVTIVSRETLAKHPTRTTKSRLRAMGVDVMTNMGTTYLNGEAV